MELWVEKYRPQTLEQYVWRDQAMRRTIGSWLEQRGLPHCLFYGPAGTGKTSMALLLLKELQITDMDALKINASRVRKIDELQDRIISFIDAWAFNPTGLKYIMLDEADKLSPLAQGMLRNEMETYADHCRFILTANYPRKLIPALRSRLQEIEFTTLDQDQFQLRAASVLTQEHVACSIEVLLAYVERTYPDLRKCLGVLQQNTRHGELLPPTDTMDGTKDYVLQTVQLFKAGRYRDARQLLIDSAELDEYPDIFRTLYRNLHWFGDTDQQQDRALLSIRDAVVHHPTVADQEINMAGLLCELSMIAAGA